MFLRVKFQASQPNVLCRTLLGAPPSAALGAGDSMDSTVQNRLVPVVGYSDLFVFALLVLVEGPCFVQFKPSK